MNEYIKNYDLGLKIVQTISTLVLVFLASKALSTWKNELIGKYKYTYSRDMIKRIKKMRFIIDNLSSENPLEVYTTQIYLADLVLEDKALKFHTKGIAKQMVVFKNSYISACQQFNLREDLDIPRSTRNLMKKVIFNGGIPIKKDNISAVLYCPDYEERDEIMDIEDYPLSPYFGKEINYGEFFKTWREILYEFEKNTK